MDINIKLNTINAPYALKLLLFLPDKQGLLPDMQGFPSGVPSLKMGILISLDAIATPMKSFFIGFRGSPSMVTILFYSGCTKRKPQQGA